MGDIGWFNALPRARAEAELMECCAARDWAETVAAGRPYRDVDSLLHFATVVLRAQSNTAIRSLDHISVLEALSGHPRIGEKAAGREAKEQAGMRTAAEETRRALAEGNRAYEERFGHVFLIRATGRDAGEMLAELRARLGNDRETEDAVVRRELAEIAGLRLRTLLGEGE